MGNQVTLKVPDSAYMEVRGMLYFARMLSKIRLYAAGILREDFHNNLGEKADAWCCNYLRVDYEALKFQTLAGGSNEDILDWCYHHGRALNEMDLFVWNNFVRKLGWNDVISKRLAELKVETGLADRDDIQTMPDFFEVDEGRKD